MAANKITPRDWGKAWKFSTSDWHKLILRRYRAARAELEDLHFHAGSAIMLPDVAPVDVIDDRSGCELTSFSVVRACYLHASANASQQLLCAGHSDASGAATDSEELSSLRARSVRAVMTGDVDAWTAVSVRRHVVRDHQLILKWAANLRHWPDCDPGVVDDDHGPMTERALRAFKRRYNDELAGALADTDDVDEATWTAFFRMYMLALADVMETDEDGLLAHRAAVKWLSPDCVGCGDNHPIPSDAASSYRSPTGPRVELLFFEPSDKPDLGGCHAPGMTCVATSCSLYRAGIYAFTPITVATNAKVALRLTEIRGLYKPGHDDPADIKAHAAKLSGYLAGYKSEDDKGRIFINQIPRASASVDWEAVKKKNKQYIELGATIDVAEGTLPAGAQVVWRWSDPDDPSDTDMRDDAAEDIDPKDFSGGKRVGDRGDDNNGDCDHPTPRSGKEPVFEQLGAYTLTAGPPGTKSCFTLIAGGRSEVRFHCTDAGGDNFRVEATVKPAPDVMVTAGDRTGVMTMWKRIDVEHRRMPSAESIPAKEIAPFFEKQFVQLDVRDEERTKSNKVHLTSRDRDREYRRFIEKEFTHDKQPGWFFVCVAQEAAPPTGKGLRHGLYEGPGRLVVEGSGAIIPPTGCESFDSPNLPRWESIVVKQVLTEDASLVVLFEAGRRIPFYAMATHANRSKGETTIRLAGIDFQSDFEPADGSFKRAYEKTALYFPRFRYRWPERIWEKKGYGFSDDVYVGILSFGASLHAGISPEVLDASGCKYFAGRTIVFSRHRGFTPSAGAKIKVIGSWHAGDVARVSVAGKKASYTVTAKDVATPPGVSDPYLFIHGQIALGIQDVINAHLSTEVFAEASFGTVQVRSKAKGPDGNGTPISVHPDVAATAGGALDLSSDKLHGGGFSDEAKHEIVRIFTHEIGHAFGFPHKCGYNTFENPAGTTCTMNYPNTWLYKLGTHRDPADRAIERFETGKVGNHFCARHTRGIRLGKLEDNPVMWKW